MLRNRTYIKPQSISGKYQIVGQYGNFISSDYGKTWTQTSLQSTNIDALAISQNGAYILICTNSTTDVYISSDYGKTFTTTPVNGSAQSSDRYLSATVSGDGRYMVLSKRGGMVLYSQDYGQNWVVKFTTLGYNFSSVSISSDGKYLLVIRGSMVEFSSNYANTFLYLGITASGGGCLSSDGKYLLLKSLYGTEISISSDYGATFSKKQTPSHYDNKPAMSGDGKYIMFSNNNDYYLSSDYGSTWTKLNFSGGSDRYKVISGDGKYMLCELTTGDIITSSDYGVSWTNKGKLELYANNAKKAVNR